MTTVSAFLAPNPRFQARDTTGAPARAGKLYTYIAGTSTPKKTWIDSERTIENTNPVVMNMAGEALIYWEDDTLYRIVLNSSDDQEIYDQDNYPVTNVAGNIPIIDSANLNNIVRNPQFSYWTNTIVVPPVMANVSTSQSQFDFIADDWLFSKTCADSTINISQGTFTPGDSEVPGFPVNYISVECTGIGAGTETNLNIYQVYNSAQTLSDTAVTLLFSARCRNVPSVNLTPHLYQNFGSGGSPSPTVDNSEGAVTLTQAWTQFRQVVTLANVNGKTFGSNLDDALILSFQFPSNELFGIIDIDSVQLTATENFVDYIFESQNDQKLRLYRNTTQQIYTSDHIMTLRSTAQPGWVVCDDGTIGNPASTATHAGMYTKALFGYLWALSNLYVPIYNSDGTPGSRTTANADFNLNKKLALTKTLGRVLGAANPGQVGIAKTFTGSDSTGKLLLTFDTTVPFYTGSQVQFAASGGGVLPTGLSPATNYYLVVINSTTVQVANSLVNAVSGTTINWTDNGTAPTLTMTTQVPALIPAEYLGEYDHALTIPEIPAHTHSYNFVDIPNTGDILQGGPPYGKNPEAPQTGGTGGSGAHNNIPPTTFIYCHLKY